MSILPILSDAVLSLLGKVVPVLDSYSWIGTQTHLIKLDALDAQLLPVAQSLGMQLPLIKYTVSLFLAYPFALILKKLPSTVLKHLFSMMGGLFLVQWIFGPDWVHSLISSAVTYLICAIAPKKYLAQIVFLWAMTYMTGCHIYRMYVSYLSGVFDFTGTQMVLTMKLTSFAYNLYDGTYDRKRVFETKHEDKSIARVYASRKEFAIDSLPNPLEFFGYVYCFTCLLAGPAFEYNDYVSGIDGSSLRKKDKLPPSSPIPSPYFASFVCFLLGVATLVLHLVVSGSYPISKLYDKDFIGSHTYDFRLAFMMVALFGDRMKYYFAWKIAEGCSVLAGFGFEGFDKDGKPIGWRKVENIDIVAFETSSNLQTLSRSWNKRTQGWLERYTYHRTGKSLNATYFVSALWHGLYPGFFIFFMSVPLLTEIERQAKNKINPLVIPSYDGRDPKTAGNGPISYVYWFVCWLCTMPALSFCVQVFTMCSWDRCMTALGSYNFIPNVAFVVIYIALAFIVPGPKKIKGEKKKE